MGTEKRPIRLITGSTYVGRNEKRTRDDRAIEGRNLAPDAPLLNPPRPPRSGQPRGILPYENADLLRFPSGPGMVRRFRRLQAVENGAIRESRLANRELINARMAFDQHFLRAE